MRQAAVWAGKTLGILALGAYPLLVHRALTTGLGATSTAVSMMLQFLVVAGILLARLPSRYKWAAACAAVLLVATSFYSAQGSLLAASGIPHAVIYLGLLALFAGSLLPGREPLISIVSRRIRGALSEEIAVYTRRVTWMWGFFFAGQLVGSLVLFLFAPVAVWSLFVNVLNFPLVVLLFGVEYAYRLVRFRDYPHASVPDMIRAFTRRDS
jgi:uncharacterized membrane protein